MTNREALLSIKIIAQNKLQELEALLATSIAIRQQLTNPDAPTKQEMEKYPEEVSVKRAQETVEHTREIIVKYRVCLQQIDKKLNSMTNGESIWDRDTFDEFGDTYADWG